MVAKVDCTLSDTTKEAVHRGFLRLLFSSGLCPGGVVDRPTGRDLVVHEYKRISSCERRAIRRPGSS